MRFVLVALLALLAGCPGDLTRNAGENDGADDQAGTGGGAAPRECFAASDCVPAGPKCCDCPTHAVPATDPAFHACENVDCPTPQCGSPMEAACTKGTCELVCSPVACEATCADGYATDGNGCLTCACATPTAKACSADSDCARVRDDCCGCTLGGSDTAVPVGQVAAHEAMLMCPQEPACPGVDVCASELAARCIAGACALVAGALPDGACGRTDLPACPQGQACVVNANDQATMHGVGVCRPAP
jgi:hypothetical protein